MGSLVFLSTHLSLVHVLAKWKQVVLFILLHFYEAITDL